MTNLLITLKNIQKEYHQHGHSIMALKDISLSINQGSSLGIVGESGSGKTTIAKIIASIEPATLGEIHCYNGENGNRISHQLWIRENLGYVFQDCYSALNPRMKIFHSVAEPIQANNHMTKTDLQEKVAETLAMVNLDQKLANAHPHELSGGQKQRACIARAIISYPKLIVLDEPTAALDIIVQAKIIRLLHQLKQDLGITFVFISHHLALVEALVDQVIVVAKGKIVEQGTVGQVFSNPQQTYTQKLISNAPSLSL